MAACTSSHFHRAEVAPLLCVHGARTHFGSCGNLNIVDVMVEFDLSSVGTSGGVSSFSDLDRK